MDARVQAGCWTPIRRSAGRCSTTSPARRRRRSPSERGSPRTGGAARLLELQRPDGQWGVGVYDGDDWDSTTDALWILRELGADPADPRVERAIALVAEQVRWEERNGGRPYFEGETEACVNGRVLTLGAYFGRPSAALVERLLGEQLDDGGWNCDAPPSIRSSFHSTICVLEGLLEYERATGADAALGEARARGEEYLLERGLLRSRSTGEVIDDEWLAIHVPTYWCYDLLRGLDHFRAAGGAPDARLAEPLATLRRMRADGRHVDGVRLPGAPGDRPRAGRGPEPLGDAPRAPRARLGRRRHVTGSTTSVGCHFSPSRRRFRGRKWQLTTW